jgi:hypothetical protein
VEAFGPTSTASTAPPGALEGGKSHILLEEKHRFAFTNSPYLGGRKQVNHRLAYEDTEMSKAINGVTKPIYEKDNCPTSFGGGYC